MQSSSSSRYHYQLQRVFVYYCSFGDKDNASLLKIQNYRRLLTDLQLFSSSIDHALISKCDVQFYAKATPAGLVLQAFSSLLSSLSELFFHGEEGGFEKLIRCHLQPLHDHIMNQTDFGRSLVLITPQLFKEHCYELLSRFQQTLTVIYSHYFSRSSRQGQQQQLKIFLKLSRELGFTPKIITKPVSHLIFAFLSQRNSTIAFRTAAKEPRFQFDLGCFMDYLIVASQLAYRGKETDQVKIYHLLQGMQVSQGYQKISKNIKLEHFFMPQDALMTPVRKSQVQTSSPMKSTQRSPAQLVETPLKKKLGEYYQPLKQKFVELCTKKRVQSNFYMPQPAGLKLLQKICPKLPASVCSGLLAISGRLSFEKFISLLDLAAERVKVQRERMYDQAVLYEEGSLGLSSVLENMKLEEEELRGCREVLALVKNYLRGLFQFYQFGGTLSLPNFIRLLKDTELTPAILGEKQASTIFTVCLKDREQGIKFTQFEQCLLRIIVSVRFQAELEGVQRLLHILQTICGSKRGETLMKRNSLSMKQHPLYKVRLVFRQAYTRMSTKFS